MESSSTEDAEAGEPGTESVDVGDLTIAFCATGSGPPLLLLHGGFSDHRAWSRQVDELADEFTVIAWDAPGCGGSDDPPEGFGLEGYADCLAELVELLDLDRPHVLGLSFGGGLAIALHARHPEIPRSLVLASAYAGWAGSLPAPEVVDRLERAERDAHRPPVEWVGDYLPTLFGPAATDEAIAETRSMMLDTRPAGMLEMLRAFAEADLRDALPRIDVPTLLLYGDADVRSPRHVAEGLYEQIPDADLVVIDGVGHCLHLEAPERFESEVRGFLARV